MNLKLIEKLVNKSLEFNLNSKDKIIDLKTKSLKIEVENLNLKFLVKFLDKISIKLISDEEKIETDVTVRAKTKALISFALTRNWNIAKKEGLYIEGDISVAEDLKDLFVSLDIDFEQMLASFTTDMFARNVFSIGKKLYLDFKAAINSSAESAVEYVTQEVNLVASKGIVYDFIEEVDILNSDVDRLEARILLLEGKSAKSL